jgi:hypothetical protein
MAWPQTVAPKPDATQAVAIAMKGAHVLFTATISGDYATVIDLTWPAAVREIGARDKAVALTEATMSQLRSRGIVLRNYHIGEPGALFAEGNYAFVVIPVEIEMTVPDGRLISGSYLLGISSDGNTWKFLDGTGLQDTGYRARVLPRLPPNLVLPALRPPKQLPRDRIDGKLVGEWQSSAPESVHLKFTQDGTLEGYYKSLSYASAGTDHQAYWAISANGTELYLSTGSGYGPGMVGLNARPHKIIELTSDKFVVEWGSEEFRSRTVEFHRVK